MRYHCILILLLVLAVGDCTKYKVTSETHNASSITLGLTYTGNQTYYIKPSSPILKNLLFSLNCHTNTDLSLRIFNSDKPRYQVPQFPPFPQDPVRNFSFILNSSQFIFTYTDDPFTFLLKRKYDDSVLFDSSKGDLIFSEHYLEIATVVDSRLVYGFGERFSESFKLREGKLTMFNRDRGGILDKENGHQTYGYFPLYLIREQKGYFHINYLRSSNAMDVIVKNYSTSQYTFTYKVIGGIFDFRFFLGDTSAEATIQRFHQYQGRAAIPPFWALGFHQCRWGYHNVSMLEEVIQGYEKHDLPLDTIWTDIDYMVKYEDFTIDEERFPLDRMNKILKDYHYMLIIDAGIKINGEAHTEGVKRDIFIKDVDGNNLVGVVWPGETNFVDFLHPNASQYWQDMLDILYQKVKFSGVWLDMNEPSNFVNGSYIKPKTHGFDYSKDLPYNPGIDKDPQQRTIALNSTHYGGYIQADVHAYFGFLQSSATYSFLSKKGLRPFIISRSTTVGSNKFTGHWTGDNLSSFHFLKYSITHNFMFQIWGIQMVGADICGFILETTIELCARWFQLGAFYPFARDHSDIKTVRQEPYLLGPEVLEAAHTNLKLRYSLLKFYYKQFVARRGYGSIFRPLFMEFPNDIKTFDDEISETQFMIGSELLFAPIVTEFSSNRTVYLPNGSNWYDYHTGKFYKSGSSPTIHNKMTESIPIFLRQGFGVICQKTTNITKTNQLNNNFTLKIGLPFNKTSKAYEGTFTLLSIQNFNDDSKVTKCINSGCLYTVSMSMNEGITDIYFQTSFDGLPELREQQIINRFEVYYEDGKFDADADPPLIIGGSGVQTIRLRQSVEK